MDVTEYRPPVKQLLAIGSAESDDEWRDYAQYGIGPEHVDELIRMATDLSLNRAPDDSREVWAPLHAWRALGQLRAERAVRPLLRLVDEELKNDDWALEDFPKVFAMIGPAAIPALSACLSDESKDFAARSGASDSLEEIAKQSPESHDECVRLLSEQLEKHARNDPALNGFLIVSLVDLQAREHFELIKEALLAGHVEEALADLPWVEVKFGLREPEPRRPIADLLNEVSQIDRPRGSKERDRQKARRKKNKRQRKAAAKSRKQSRRRK